MQTLNQNELRQIEGGNVIIQAIEWGIKAYRIIKRIKDSNYPIGPIFTTDKST